MTTTDTYSIEALFSRLQSAATGKSTNSGFSSKKVSREIIEKHNGTQDQKGINPKGAPFKSSNSDESTGAQPSIRVTKDSSKQVMDVVLTKIRDEIQASLRQAGMQTIRSRFDTSDIVQESMVQIWMQIRDSDVEHLEFTRGLLSVIAKGHRAKQFRRHGAARRSIKKEAGVANSDLPSHKTSPLDSAEIREQIGLLLEALRLLSPLRQFIVFRRFFDDRSYQQIGDELGKSKEWARQQCHKAQKRLRQLLRH